MNPIFIPKTNCRNTSPPVRLFVIATGAAMVLAAGASSSCNTTRGLGQDIEKAGEQVQKASNEVYRH